MDQLPKMAATIVEYLKHVYNYTEQDAAKAVDYLMQVREIAVEFVYYIEHGEFIPERYASNFHGYTAKQLNNKPFLSLLGAFNYMVYLKTKPERALAHIEKSFPRRVIINAEEEAQLRELLGNKLPSFLLQPPLLSNTKRITKSYTMSTSVRLG